MTNNSNEIVTNGQEFPYWDNNRTQPAGSSETHQALNNFFTPQPQNQPIPNLQVPQQNFTQPIQQQPQQSLSIPGNTLSLIIETEIARVRITFEPK